MALTDTQLGSGLFKGRAAYGNGAFRGAKEDVSIDIGLISPHETPLLSIIGDAEKAATNLHHEWLEESLNPNVLVTSTALTSVTTNTTIVLANRGGAGLRPGTILIGPASSDPSEEYFQVTAVAPTSITVSRQFGGTSAASAAAGVKLVVQHRAGVEGEDVQGDSSRPRIRRHNVVGRFFYEIIISDTQEAITQHGGIDSEFDHQAMQRLKECMRDLEKAVIRSRAHMTQDTDGPGGLTGTNVIGGAGTTRTFMGLEQLIKTNKYMSQSIASNRTAADINAFEDQVLAITAAPYAQGATDCNLILVGDLVKRRFDLLNANRSRTNQQEKIFQQLVDRYENQYGSYTVMQNRWMPRNGLLLLAPGRIKIAPLQGMSFHKEIVARSGSAVKGMIQGEYTVELRNEDGMAQARWPAMLDATDSSILAP